MIPIPFDRIKLDSMATDYYQILQDEMKLSKKLNKLDTGDFKPLFTYLKPRLIKIIAGRPSDLERMLPRLSKLSQQIRKTYSNANPLLDKDEITKWFNTQVFKSFNYAAYLKLKDGTISYEHARKLGMDTCPYCNAQFTYIIEKPGAKSRPQFDHFISKSKHPYFALSFYNLIPSCHVCNSNLKGEKKFRTTTHIHPFIDHMDGFANFKTSISSVDFLVNRKDFEIGYSFKYGTTNANKLRTENSLEAFCIIDRYKYHKDYASDMIYRAHMALSSRVKELLEWKVGNETIFKNEEEVKEIILGKYLQHGAHHKRILSKLSKDIAEEFGLNYTK